MNNSKDLHLNPKRFNAQSKSELILCFWGNFWSSEQMRTSSSSDYRIVIDKIAPNPYEADQENGLGLENTALIYIELNDSSSPQNGLSNKEVEEMLIERLNSSEMPAPIEGCDRHYAVILPPGLVVDFCKKNASPLFFNYKSGRGFYLCFDHQGNLVN